MLVMFLCIVIGFIANKKKLVPKDTATALSKLENYFLVPALILNTFMSYCTVQSITEYYDCIIFCIITIAMAIPIAYLGAPIFDRSEALRPIYRYALTFGNFGFMGNAIVPAIMGEEFLYPYMLFTLPLNFICYTWGVMGLMPKGNKNVLKTLVNPTVISIAVGSALGLLGVTKYVPGFIMTTIKNLAACMGPVAMILTGHVIGDYKITGLLKMPKVYIATFIRLFLLPAVYIAVLWLLKADRNIMFFCLFAYATPLGLNTIIYPAAYGGDTHTGASMAMISHTVCVITIPIVYAILNMLV